MSLEPGLAATLACLLEATARKPGNVHRFADFADVTYLDFALSAAVIAEPMAKAAGRPLGQTILDAVISTRRVVATNTNLGIILLIAPLAAVETREQLASLLDSTTVDDAHHVYEAIRISNPGGMGQTTDQDIANVPSVTLLEAMRLAADRDQIAYQYTTGFSTVYDVVSPILTQSLRDQPLETAILTTQLTVLSKCADSLIVRKRGVVVAQEASQRAADVLRSGWPGSVAGLREFDVWLRADGHARNPGTTADLVTAALFLALRSGTIDLIETRHTRGWATLSL